jgi:peptidoglycan/xylan/chitin deacetylase (PgdA/CDA1 family)
MRQILRSLVMPRRSSYSSVLDRVRSVEGAWLEASPWTGALALAERRLTRRPRTFVLCYHRVRPDSTADFRSHATMDVTPEQFEAHLGYLVRRVDVVPLDEAVARWYSGEPVRRPSVAITFDDAYRDVLEFAAPLLARYGCTATVFVPVGYIDTGQVFWWDLLDAWMSDARRRVEIDGVVYDPTTGGGRDRLCEAMRRRLTAAGPRERETLLAELERQLAPRHTPSPSTMSWREIEAVGARGQIAFGAHTVNHFGVSRLTDAELAAELSESCRALGEHLDAPSAVFAYPYGRYADLDPRPAPLLRALGCLGAATLVAGSLEGSPSPFALRRIFVERKDDVSRLRAKLAGVDATFWRLRHALARGDRRLPSATP